VSGNDHTPLACAAQTEKPVKEIATADWSSIGRVDPSGR